MKPVRLTTHAREQCVEPGASESEVVEAIARGLREPARRGRSICRHSFEYGALWHGRFYAPKQVAPVVAEGQNEMVVVTVCTFYF